MRDCRCGSPDWADVDGHLVTPGAQCRQRALPSRTGWLVFAGSVVLYLIYRIRVAPRNIDLAVYRATGAAVLHGHPVYGNLHLFDGLKATYPPFAALTFAPLALLKLAALQYVILAINVALLVTIAILTCRLLPVPRESHRSIALVAAGIGLACEPVVSTLNLGQIDLVIVALTLVDLTRRDGARLRGAGIGLATALKLTPGLFIVYLLLTGRHREAGVAVATFTGASALGWLLLPGASRAYWTKLIFDVRRVGLVERPDNQSMRGLFARIAGAADVGAAGVVIIAAVAIVGLGVARLAYLRLGDAWGASACAFTALLVAPISWTHHWVWCLPVAMLLWFEARRWSIAVVVFWSYLVMVPHNAYTSVVRYGPWATLLSGAYVYFGILFLALTGYRALRARPRPNGPEAADQAQLGVGTS